MLNKPKYIFLRFFVPALLLMAVSCVDQLEYNIGGRINTLVVDGLLTTADEQHTVRIYRAKSDEATGKYDSAPITGIVMELVVDGTQTVAFTEDKVLAGKYYLPEHFRAQVGKSYQLKFRLPDGTNYESTIQKVVPVPAMTNVKSRFVPNQAADARLKFNGFHELYIDTQDPADQQNFYSWEWTQYEKQDWCKSCSRGVYAVNAILPGVYLDKRYFVSGNEPFEDCFSPKYSWDNDWSMPPIPNEEWTYDYQCRTQCWQVFRNPNLNLFDDRLTNGGKILQRSVARIPFYQHGGSSVELRQLSLDKDAYNYFKLFQQQTENTGGIADTPPTALRGNIKNVQDAKESIVGYFQVSDVSIVRHWVDRKDTGASGITPPGLFEALNGRAISPEPSPNINTGSSAAKILIYGGPPRLPTALCIKSDARTPVKPQGWVDLQ